MATAGERTAWTNRLAHVPSWALSEELQRRGEEDDRDQRVVLAGLVVDPIGSSVTWRGDEYAVGGRQMEVLYALALDRAGGRRRVATRRLAERVFRGFEREGACANLRVVMAVLRRRFPGLIDSVWIGSRVAYGLALADAPAAAADVA
jgi:DNA-binding response OmpR family regulator